MFYADCFVFAELNFHVIKFDQINNDETFALFKHDVNCFDDFVFFIAKSSLTKIKMSSI